MRWPLLILALYAVASLATFIAYALDKRAATRGTWRVRERTLHLFELAGGWPGALLAQRLLRHKTIDRRFRLIFWLIVATHVLFWSAILISRVFHSMP